VDLLCRAREIFMPDKASAAGGPAGLTERVRLALESSDLDAISDLLDPGARWGAPEGPHDADCQNRDQVVAWWASARAAGARAVVTEVTAGGHFWWDWQSPAHRRLARRAERWSAGRS
jgi:SnoaL-like protein